LDLLPWV
jgi:hypothetical protein